MATIVENINKLKMAEQANQKAIARLSRRQRNRRNVRNRRNAQSRRQVVPQGTIRPVNVVLDADTQRWVNVMTNPFGSNNGCQIPDAVVAETMVFKDYNAMGQYSLYGSTTDLGGDPNDPITTPASSTGVCFFAIPGKAEKNVYYDATQSNTTQSGINVEYYHIGAALINSSGQLSGVGDSQYYYNVIVPANESTLFAAEAANSLVTGLRIAGFGFRMWPVVGMITDSSTQAIATIQAGSMTMDAFFTDFFTSGTRKSIYDGVNSSPNFKSYSNQQGVTCRFNCIQGNNFRYYNMKTQETWTNQDNYLDDMQIPIVVIKFMQAVDGTGEDTPLLESEFANLPYYFQSVFWLEGIPQVPTPLMPTKSPIDFGFDAVAKSIQASGQLFPTITEGHSFLSISKKLGRFARHTSNFISKASAIGKRVQRVSNRIADEFEEKDG